MKDLLTGILCIITILAFGTFCEKVRYPALTTAEAIRKFRDDLGKILRASFERVRHIFEDVIYAEFLKVLTGMYHEAFPPEFFVTVFDKVPVIRITFVPIRDFEDAELLKVCRLLGMKFRAYLQAHFLNWKFFTEFYRTGDTILINIWYAEFKEDYIPFMKRYRISVKQKATPDFGLLRDDQLDRELKNVK